MERIIIIDDKKCEKELADFLEANKDHIRYSNTLENIQSNAKGLYEELTTHGRNDEKLAISSNQHIDIVHTSDITHLEAGDQKTILYLMNKSAIETKSNLDSFLIKLKGSNFLRVHKNYIVNLDYFSKLIRGKSTSIQLSNGTSVPVDAAKENLLLNYLNKIEI